MRAPRRALSVVAVVLGLTGASSPALAAPEAATERSSAVSSAAPRPVVKGDILARYNSLGGSRGFLGAALTSETRTPNRTGAYNVFQGGSIYWTPNVGAWEVHGAIRANWGSLGHENSALGFPTSNELALPGGAAYSSFQGGLVYFAPGVGAQEVRGAILGKYDVLAREKGRLGFPVTNELGTPDGEGRYNVFQRGSIYWTSDTGANQIEGAIRDRWAAVGFETSSLGYPVSDEFAVGEGGRASDFEGGQITWTPATGAYVSAFLDVASAVDKAQDVFSVATLQQDFRYDDNDEYAVIVVEGEEVTVVPATKAEFEAQLEVDSLVGAQDYSLDPADTALFVVAPPEIVPAQRAALQQLLGR